MGEPACRPGSVPPLARGDGHPSGTAVAGSLVRPTREHRAGSPRALAQGTVIPLLTLLRVGFTEPPQSRTVAPLLQVLQKVLNGQARVLENRPERTLGTS